METIRSAGFHSTLNKVRVHTNIRGNYLDVAAAKLAVRTFDTLPPARTTRVDIGEATPRPTHWVMYTATPPRSDPAITTSTNNASFRRPWWTIPEADHLEMRAFTRPSQHLQLKGIDAKLRSLHYSSLHRCLCMILFCDL